jgi:hypothetical protein
MAVESKPLFHPEVLRQQVRSFNLPEHTDAWRPKLQHWADLIASGRADGFKETALLPDFLTDVFCGLLGYTGPAATADTYTLSRERHVEVDGKFADAVLGRSRRTRNSSSLSSKARVPAIPWTARSPGGASPPWTKAMATPSTSRDWIIVPSSRCEFSYANTRRADRSLDA